MRVGSEVTHVQVGDIVGVGAQNDSCLECGQCKNQREPYCDKGLVGTYAGVYQKGNGKGDKSYGGCQSLPFFLVWILALIIMMRRVLLMLRQTLITIGLRDTLSFRFPRDSTLLSRLPCCAVA